jgi:hypothetical protein
VGSGTCGTNLDESQTRDPKRFGADNVQRRAAVLLPARSLNSCCVGSRAIVCEAFYLVNAGLILYPQRDSNPCCRLESAKLGISGSLPRSFVIGRNLLSLGHTVQSGIVDSLHRFPPFCGGVRPPRSLDLGSNAWDHTVSRLARTLGLHRPALPSMSPTASSRMAVSPLYLVSHSPLARHGHTKRNRTRTSSWTRLGSSSHPPGMWSQWHPVSRTPTTPLTRESFSNIREGRGQRGGRDPHYPRRRRGCNER